MSVTLIVDSTILSFNGGVWTQSPAGSWYNGSALFSSKATSTSTDFLDLHFEGTSVSWVGVTPPQAFPASFLVNIDGSSENFTATYPQNNEVGCTWWTSPLLDDSSVAHKITLYNVEQIILDYVLVTAGTQTNFTGQTIFIDDSNPEIVWLGQWVTANDYTIETGSYQVMPAGNGTHTSNTPGDSFSFTFAGTSIYVYGVMSFASLGTIDATFSIDGESYTPRSFNASGLPNNDLINASNYELFSAENLSASDHTLRVNVTGVTGHLPFIIDYLTYVSTFSSLASKPNLSGQAVGIGNLNNGPSNSSSSNSSGGSSVPTGDTSSSDLSRTPTGAIAGGVVGGLVLAAFIIGAVLYFRRQKLRSESKYLQATPYIRSNDKLATQPYSDRDNSNHTSGQVLDSAYPMQNFARNSWGSTDKENLDNEHGGYKKFHEAYR